MKLVVVPGWFCVTPLSVLDSLCLAGIFEGGVECDMRKSCQFLPCGMRSIGIGLSRGFSVQLVDSFSLALVPKEFDL